MLVFDCVPILPDWFFGLASQRKFSLAGRDWASNLSWSTDQKLKRDDRFTSPLVCGMTHRVMFIFCLAGRMRCVIWVRLTERDECWSLTRQISEFGLFVWFGASFLKTCEHSGGNRCDKRRIRASKRRRTSEHTYNNQHFWRKIDPVLKKRDLFVFSIFGFGFVLFLRRKTNFQAINATIWWLAGLPRWWHETLPDCRKKFKGIAEVFAIFRLREKFYQFQLYWNCECLVSNC